MEKAYNLFKKFLPIVITLSLVSLIFGLITMINYYNSYTVSIDFANVIPIFAIIFIVASFATAIYFSVKVEAPQIKRLKKSSGFSKFATLLVAILAIALFLYDFLKFVDQPALSFSTQSKLFKTLRLLVFVQFIVYLVIGILPKKIKHKKIEIPKWIKPFTAVCTVIWCILGIASIYFFNGLATTNLFKIIFVFYYIALTVFFLFESRFEIFGTGHKAYMISSLIMFIYSIAIVGSIMSAQFLGYLSEVSISEFEIFLAAALGIYALSKLFAMQQTMKYIINKDESGSGRHHHHRHHSSSNKEASEASADAVKEAPVAEVPNTDKAVINEGEAK